MTTSHAIVIILFPIVFMLHEFEELIWMRPWLRCQDEGFWLRTPKRLHKPIRDMLGLSAERFASIIGYEFLLATFAAVAGLTGSTPGLAIWFSALTLYTLHLFVHIVQAIVVGRLLPPLATSLLSLPLCGYAYHATNDLGFLTIDTAPLFGVSLLLWIGATVFGFVMIGGIGRRRTA